MSERWVARATGRHLNGGGLPDEFTADDAFGPQDDVVETPGEKSRSRFQFLKMGDRFVVGGKAWVTVRDLGAREKLVGEPDYFDVNDSRTHIAVLGDGGVVAISLVAKRGEYRPVGKVLARGLLE